MRTLENLISDKKYKNHNFKIGSINGSSFWIATHNSPKLKSKIIELYEKHRKQEQRARLKRNVDDLLRILEEERDSLGFLFKTEAQKMINAWELQIYNIDQRLKREVADEKD